MVVGNLDVISIPIIPAKANAVLVVDPDAMLPLAVSCESFQPVSGNRGQVAERDCPVQMDELAKRDLSDRMKLFRELLPEGLFRFGISKGANHEYIVYRKAVNVKGKTAYGWKSRRTEFLPFRDSVYVTMRANESPFRLSNARLPTRW